MAQRAKTNLVNSITLGTVDILSDTAMNDPQQGVVHTIESCGGALLDTINNLLDLTFIDKYQKKRVRRRMDLLCTCRRLETHLDNVFGNALKYTRSGFIYLGMKLSRSPKRYGKGISPRFLHKDLFKPFAQEEPFSPGSGLGLGIVREAVGCLGGTIELIST
ncbi:hypothetical protein EYZ11_012635 [Aspergillus tanneri]|nr:hypothetical protein EYZ11_012635 [Aspergillus tanneri]